MKREIYANAPIVEAVLDVRVRMREEIDLATLSHITDKKYPETYRQPFQIQVKIEGGNAPAQPTIEQLSTPLGTMYRSEDQKQVFQARIDGFTFNRLAPYQDWASFSKEAKRLWKLYVAAVPPHQIEALSLTYLNELVIPTKTKFEDYFRTYIQVAPEIPQDLNNYSLSFQVTLKEGRGLLSVTQGYGPPRKEGHVTIILNLQATRVFGESDNPSDENIWEIFEHLREAKSDAFEACITNAVREMIR
jgi:uncharacterized protein (TIGR04255 family)